MELGKLGWKDDVLLSFCVLNSVQYFIATKEQISSSGERLTNLSKTLPQVPYLLKTKAFPYYRTGFLGFPHCRICFLGVLNQNAPHRLHIWAVDAQWVALLGKI